MICIVEFVCMLQHTLKSDLLRSFKIQISSAVKQNNIHNYSIMIIMSIYEQWRCITAVLAYKYFEAKRCLPSTHISILILLGRYLVVEVEKYTKIIYCTKR